MSKDTGYVTLMVSKSTESAKFAGAVAHELRKGSLVKTVAIGKEALYRMVKGLATANRYLVADKISITLSVESNLLNADRPEEAIHQFVFTVKGNRS